jgi:hypothetical protein
VVPPLSRAARGPHAVAKDDLGTKYEDLGGAFAEDSERDRTDGVLTMPLPPPQVTTLRLRLNWGHAGEDLWRVPAHQVRIVLATDAR